MFSDSPEEVMGFDKTCSHTKAEKDLQDQIYCLEKRLKTIEDQCGTVYVGKLSDENRKLMSEDAILKDKLAWERKRVVELNCKNVEENGGPHGP